MFQRDCLSKRNEFYLDDKEQYIPGEKFKLSGVKSKSAFIRKLIPYGYVYNVDYSFLQEYNTEPPKSAQKPDRDDKTLPGNSRSEKGFKRKRTGVPKHPHSPRKSIFHKLK